MPAAHWIALAMHAITIGLALLIWRPLRRGPGPTPIETTLGIAMIASNTWLAWMNLTN